MNSKPGYIALSACGELARRVEEARGLLSACTLCPHECAVDRLRGEKGACRMDARIRVASWNLHRWEEPPISGTRGSGAVFFSGCSGHCRFCQNYPTSQLGHGVDISSERLAGMMLELQRRGAHNINLVTPTHFVPQILAALHYAIRGGLCLPLVYNTGGYESVKVLRLLEGIVDLWLPDAKYADDALALRLSGFPHYVEHNQAALREMLRQVGPGLALDEEGVAQRGIIVRHLVLPDGLAGTDRVLHWLAGELSPDIHISLMDQYFPAYRALDDPVLGRRLTAKEYESALDALEAAGLEHGWSQGTRGDDLE